MATQPPTQWIGTPNMTTGRCAPGQPLAIVLHEVDLSLAYLDGDSSFVQSSASNHVSFHYGIEGCNIHEYVKPQDTAWSFSPTVNLAPWAVAVANPGINPNCYTLNIAVTTGVTTSSARNCPRPANFYTAQTKQCLAQLLCYLSKTYNIALDAIHVWRHGSELSDMPFTDILADAVTCFNAVPVNPVPSFCSQVATLTDGGAATGATKFVGSDCKLYTVPALLLKKCGNVALDAATDLIATCADLATLPVSASLSNGTLTVGVNGSTATVPLRGQLETDAFGVPLGYLLPLT